MDKEKIKKRAKSITADVLETLFIITEGFADLATSRAATYRHLRNYDRDYDWTESKLGRWLDNLRYGKYIKITEDSTSKKSVEFTNKGKIRIIDSIADQIENDNKNRFVSFDIPEDMTNNRDGFRRAIKRIGFKRIQQSLWVINKNVSELVEMLAYEYKVEKYIVYIIAESSDIDGIIEKMLK
ncbi:MAG: hypothetical protein NTW79_00180 [Candidatus Berkelbacteria bacterium]|nr:hypothetical protein [Candidatus Berkelbacteria bacterium]